MPPNISTGIVVENSLPVSHPRVHLIRAIPLMTITSESVEMTIDTWARLICRLRPEQANVVEKYGPESCM
jgi:hypothetical protein